MDGTGTRNPPRASANGFQINDIANSGANANPHTSRRLIRLSHEFQHGLAGNTRAWARFKDTDIAYFSPLTVSQQSSIINIANDMRDLDDFRESLSQQGVILQTLSSSVCPLSLRPNMFCWEYGQSDTLQLFALDNKNAAKINSLLTATAVMFLPFVLMALIAAPPSLSANKVTPGWYIFASFAIAAPTAIFLAAMANGEASLKMIEDASERIRNTKTPDLKAMRAALEVDKPLHGFAIPFQGHVQRLGRLATLPTMPAMPSLPHARSFPGVSRLHVLPRVDTDGVARIVGEAKKLVEGLWRGWRHAGLESFSDKGTMDEEEVVNEDAIDEDVMDERLAPVLEDIEEVDEREVLIRMIEEEEGGEDEEECVVAAVTGM